MQTSIVINAAGRDITVQPTRIAFPINSGSRNLRWFPAGNSVDITDITFDDANAPITEPQKQANGDWTATWNTDGQVEKLWKYSVTVRIGTRDLPTLDPEIENGPPGGLADDGGG